MSNFKMWRVDGAGLPFLSDLDDLFAARESGDPAPPAPTGFVTGGADLNVLYKPLSAGNQLEFDTYFRINGNVDLRNVFAKKESGGGGGPVPTSRVFFSGLQSSMGVTIVGDETNIGQALQVNAIVSFGRNGSTTQQRIRRGSVLQTVNGTWHMDAVAAGVGDGYEIQYDDTGINTFGMAVNIVNPAPSFTPITSDFYIFQIDCNTISGNADPASEALGPLVIRIRHTASGTISTYTVNMNLRADPI